MANDKLSVDEIRKHSTPEDCWLVVDGKVWDFSDFAAEHPGGSAMAKAAAKVIYKHAGRDASASYNSIHAPELITQTIPQHLKGRLDESTIDEEWTARTPEPTREAHLEDKPPLETIISCFDFERIAQRTYSKKNWAFYSSGATDLVTRDANRSMLDRIFFRPRVMVNVRSVVTRSRILGDAVDMPLFVSPAALAKLVHPEGEKAIARACAAKGIVQIISNNASFTCEDIVNATPPTHPSIFQLYFNTDRSKTIELVPRILALRPRIRAICVTVDAAVPGKREADERVKADESISAPNSGQSSGNDKLGGGLGRIMGSYIDAGLEWSDLHWLRQAVGPTFPLLIKGIQGAADARLALQAGVQGIIVSNHGGRSLDGAPPAVLTLLELHRHVPEVFARMEVWIDSGVRRGTDIVKCMALGATACGMGRPPLYALNYGQEGVEHLFELIKDELETTMKLVGISSLDQVRPEHINTRDIDHLVPAPSGGWFRALFGPRL